MGQAEKSVINTRQALALGCDSNLPLYAAESATEFVGIVGAADITILSKYLPKSTVDRQ